MKSALWIIGGLVLITASYPVVTPNNPFIPKLDKIFEGIQKQEGKNDHEKVSPTQIQESIEADIQKNLQGKQLKVIKVEFYKYSDRVNITLDEDKALTVTNVVRNSWKALYTLYNEFPEVKSYGIASMQGDDKILQITGTRDELRQILKSRTTEVDKSNFETGNMQAVAPILQRLNYSGNNDLIQVIEQNSY